MVLGFTLGPGLGTACLGVGWRVRSSRGLFSGGNEQEPPMGSHALVQWLRIKAGWLLSLSRGLLYGAITKYNPYSNWEQPLMPW